MTFRHEDIDRRKSLIELRPMDLSEILDGMIRVYRRAPWSMIGIYAVFLGLPVFLQQIASLLMPQDMQTGNPFAPFYGPAPLPDFSSPEFMVAMPLMVVSLVLMFFAAPFAEAGLVHAISEAVLGREVNIRESLRLVWRKIGDIFLAYVLLGFIIGVIAFFFLILPLIPVVVCVMIYVLIKLLFIPHAVVLDNLGAFQAVKRSYSLTSGYWWRTLWILICIGFMVGLITILLRLGLTLLAGLIGSIPGISPVFVMALNGVFATMAAVVVQPLGDIATTLMYYDLRIRKEGFDLVHLAESVAGEEEQFVDLSDQYPGF